MIKYKLICKSCYISFDSWFASSDEFDKLKKMNFLSCFKCNSQNIDKTLMAPKLITNLKVKKLNNESLKAKKINKKIKEYQKFIKNNFDYVGKNFSYEARSIHYNKRKKEKGIYGIATNEEIRELREEGISTETIPWLQDKNN